MADFELCDQEQGAFRIQTVKTTVPTYNGKWVFHGSDEYGEGNTPVLICPADGLRVVLGAHDYFNDYQDAEIQIERRRNGWMFFLIPKGVGDPCGYVVFLDDGRSFAVTEPGAGDFKMEFVEHETAVAELDGDAEPQNEACSPTIITRRSDYD